MALLKYTTQVPAARTISEMQAALGEHGASAITVQYEAGKPSGIGFALPTTYGVKSFTLPVNVDAVQRLLAQQGTRNSRVKSDRPTAERVAWRIVRDWLFAQLALIEAEQATIDQVMLPYLHVDADRTLYDAFRARELAAAEVRELEG